MQNRFNGYSKILRWMPLVFIAITTGTVWFLYKYYSIGIPGAVVGVIITFMVIREGVTLVLARRLNKRVLKPVEELTHAFEALSQGEYGHQIDNVYFYHMQDLVDSFNDMSNQLLISQNIKEKYDRNQKELIAGISHDLKSPITSIIGYLEGIEEGVPDSPEKLAAYLKVIYTNATYVNRLIDDLFLISKLDLDEMKFNMIPVKAKHFFQDVLFEKQLEYEHVKFKYTIDVKEEVCIKVDSQLFIRVLNNIYDNAVKYNDKVQCKIFTEVTFTDGFMISIWDNGSGLEPDKLETIFSKFYRVDASRSKAIGGSGLGLSIAREIVEKHGGTINARNRDGGLEMIIRLEGGVNDQSIDN
jgi:signal transduction histidine kinase